MNFHLSSRISIIMKILIEIIFISPKLHNCRLQMTNMQKISLSKIVDFVPQPIETILYIHSPTNRELAKSTDLL